MDECSIKQLVAVELAAAKVLGIRKDQVIEKLALVAITNQKVIKDSIARFVVFDQTSRQVSIDFTDSTDRRR